MLPNKSERNLKQLRDAFDHFFYSGFPIFGEPAIRLSVSEETNFYLIEAELPGVEKEKIQIDFEEEHLTIKANKTGAQKISEGEYLYKEITSGTVTRTIYLPESEAEKTEAEYRDGLLKLKVPKKERDDRNNRINIEIK